MKFLKKISRLFTVNWSVTIQYRGDLLLWMMTEAATPLVSLAVWYTVATTSSQGFSPQETFTYYILLMFVITMTGAWSGFFMASEILRGEIIKRLIRPIPVFWSFILQNIGEKILKLFIPLPLFALALYLRPQVFSASIFEGWRWLWFVISIILAAALAFTIDMIFGLLAFWLEDAMQIRNYKDALEMITSGILIPIAFMPANVQAVVKILPFRHIITTPIDTLLHAANTQAMVDLVTAQAWWVVGTIIIFAITWRQGLKRYAPPGQ